MANTIQLTEQKGVQVVGFAPRTELDAANIAEMQAALYRLVDEGRDRRMVLDLSNVQFASSQALGCFVTLRLKAARTNCNLVMAAVPAVLLEIVQLTQLDKLYEIHPSLPAAIERLTSG
ncbi:MAG: STAS domain-containing protein [Phycisphaerae bacterium]